jgi:mannosyltransferase
MTDTTAPTRSAHSAISRIAPPARSDRSAAIAIAAITLGGGLLWFWRLGSKSLFLDEGFTASTVLRSWRSLVELSVVHETSGVLHAFLLRPLTELGQSEAVLRSLSAMCLIALVPVVGALGWRLVSPRVGVLGSLLLVVNGTVANFAQYDRTYALSMLLAGVATLIFTLEVEQPRRATVLGWSACCVLLAYSHIYGILLVVCHLGSLWFLPAPQRMVRRRGIAAAIVTLLTIPEALAIYNHNEGQEGISRIRPGVYRDLLFTFSGRAGLLGLAAFGLVAVLSVRVTIRTWRAQRHGRQAWVQALLVLWAGLPVVTFVILSPITPVIGRYLMFSVVGALLYGAVGLDDAIRGTSGWSWLRGWRRFAPLVLVLAAGVYGLHYWYTDGGAEDWRGASRHVLAEAEPGDRILFANDSVRLYFEYYRRFADSSTLPEPVYPDDPWGGYETGDQRYLSFDEAVIDRLTAEPSERVWVVVGLNHINTEDVPEVLRGMSTAYDEVERRVFDGDVEVILFAPR